MTLPIYLDFNATTPVATEVANAIEPYLREHFGNPSSNHLFGQRAHDAVERARAQVATLIGAKPEEIVFTGCATEANNLAILGVARAMKGRGRHLITSAVEHPAVSAPMTHLREEGWEVRVLPVDATGRVVPADLVSALRADTVLVSVMHANNEVGTLQPIAELAALAKRHGALFHTDAAQSVGKVPVDVDALGVDLLILAGHKFYAPKGIGALYVREGTPIEPILFGAGHEHGLRPGTENLPHIVGLGMAAEMAQRKLPEVTERLHKQRDALHQRLAAVIPGLILNGHPEQRLPNTLNLSFPGVSGRALLDRTPSVAASVGSACHEEVDAVSGVLGAMGVETDRAGGAVRLSIGEPTTDDEIRLAADALIGTWRSLSSHSNQL
ncbi:cysteine desulfurase family protein [Sedimenticola selenatireducens]|uniref:cysteine desulfurase family protein n=1 Tax=Sedimenticola selenatireducens TaxID=191960 RepID=UPI00048E27D3|nr:cysteine desulfurase family protein [Sedimenticola selenatireducens]